MTDAGELRGLLAEVLFASLELERRKYGPRTTGLIDISKLFHVDPAKIRQQARTDVDRYLKAVEGRKAKKAPARKKAKAKAPRAKATRRKRRI